ncbi:thioesterase-like superfamily-domain-containing protein [Favolaschia claudopus]|uniref:Thioesterase-like superfamily-domain-containing protein n=1 Tax=Favolaschia claudopus TaxID=2862362 RepID=A0AAW0C9G1_9AGAR
MPAWTKAVEVARKNDSPDSTLVCYTAFADPDWRIGVVPNGGYVLALIVQACIEFQRNTELPDPLHVSTHYLQPTQASTVEVQLRVLKRGRSFVNILADLVQGGRTCVTTHMIFGRIPPTTRPIIDPSSGYARRLPGLAHPSEAVPNSMVTGFVFSKHVRWAVDPSLQAQNAPDSPNRQATEGGGLAVWGAWIEYKDENERITPSSLAFFADCVETMGHLFPPVITGHETKPWLPTLNLTLEWKAPIPPPSAMHSGRTVGIYLTSGFLSEPQCRHTTIIEVWTAPSNIGQGTPVEGWRDAQVCLGVATQMQLMVNPSVNAKAGTKL